MFKIIILQLLYNLSDDQVEFQIRDMLSLMRFLVLSLSDTVPDAKTIWLFREELGKAGLMKRLFKWFDRRGTLNQKNSEEFYSGVVAFSFVL